MNELKELFSERISTFLDSGAVEEKIDAAIGKCFDDCVDSAFRWGDLKKSIEQVVTEKMQISLSQIEIQSYNTVLEEALRQKMTKFSGDAAAQMFSDAMKDLFAEAPKEITMDELAEGLLKKLRQENDDPGDYGEYFHIVFEQEHGSSITFKISDSESGYTDKKVHLLLLENDDDYYIALNHEMDITNPTCLHGIDKYLFQLYAGKTKITDVDSFDPDDLDTRKVDAEY